MTYGLHPAFVGRSLGWIGLLGSNANDAEEIGEQKNKDGEQDGDDEQQSHIAKVAQQALTSRAG